MARKVATLQQTSGVIKSLYRAGFYETRQLLDTSAVSASVNLSNQPAESRGRDDVTVRSHDKTSDTTAAVNSSSSAMAGDVVDDVRRAVTSCTSAVTAGIVSADQLSVDAGHVTTFSRELDQLLGDGGFMAARITELVGRPGSGKTQLCLQACVDACLPACVGAADGSAIYVDTEGAVVASRLRQMAVSACGHCSGQLSADEVMSRISVITLPSISSCHSQLQLLLLLPLYLSQQLQTASRTAVGEKSWPLRLLVIDSVAAVLRDGSQLTHMERSWRLQWLMGELARLARRHHFAVVVTNHVTSDVSSDTGHVQLVAALGASWQHCCSVRVALTSWCSYTSDSMTTACRQAHLIKHPNFGHRSALFQILTVGIRDCNQQQQQRNKKNIGHSSLSPPAMKKFKAH